MRKHQRQPGLLPARLGGEVLIDPAADDFFSTVIEQRRQLTTRAESRPASPAQPG
jgi:hypothetical protein